MFDSNCIYGHYSHVQFESLLAKAKISLYGLNTKRKSLHAGSISVVGIC
jgi:hypothetical protein